MSAITVKAVAKVQDVNSNERSDSSVQQPGELIRPVLADGAAEEVLQRVYGMTAREVKELNSYDDRNYFVAVDEKHTNKAVAHLHTHGYLLKFTNSKYSQNHLYFDAQHDFMSHLNKRGIPTQVIVPNLKGDNYSMEEIYADKDKQGVPGKYMVELRTFLAGKIIQDIPYTPELLKQNGQFIAKMSLALKDFHHSFYVNRDLLWSVTSVPLLTNYTFCLENKKDRMVVEEVVAAFNKEVVPAFDRIPKGYIHGDANEQNILVSQDATSGLYHVSGILDYTDVTNSYTVLDLAVNIAYFMIDSAVLPQLDTPGYILAGYLSVRDLTDEEWGVLPYCIAGRLAQSLTLGAHASYLEPEHEYLLTTAAKGWPLLHKFWSHPRAELVCRWKNIISSVSGTGNSSVDGAL